MTFDDQDLPETVEDKLRKRLLSQASNVEAPLNFRHSISELVNRNQRAKKQRRFGAGLLAAAAMVGVVTIGSTQLRQGQTVAATEGESEPDSTTATFDGRNATEGCQVALTMWVAPGAQETSSEVRTLIEELNGVFANNPETIDNVGEEETLLDEDPPPSPIQAWVWSTDVEEIVARGEALPEVDRFDIGDNEYCWQAGGSESQDLAQQYFDDLAAGKLDQVSLDENFTFLASNGTDTYEKSAGGQSLTSESCELETLELCVEEFQERMDATSEGQAQFPQDPASWTYNSKNGELNLLDTLSNPGWKKPTEPSEVCLNRRFVPLTPGDQVSIWLSGETCADSTVIQFTLNNSNQLTRIDVTIPES